MSINGRKSGEFVIKQEEVATDVDAFVGHNEYLKSQMVEGSNLHLASNGHTRPRETEVQGNGAGSVEELQRKIESLNRELLIEKQTRNAAEEALKHLQEVYSKADAKVQDITTKLAEAQQKMEQEIKIRSDRNVEREMNLNRLHERKKQLNLEVQELKTASETYLEERREEIAKKANESSASRYKRPTQAQHRVVPMGSSSSSSSSSSSDSSSDESENEYGEPSNANPIAALQRIDMDAMMDNCVLKLMLELPTIESYMMELLHEMARRHTDAPRQAKRKRAPVDRNRSKGPAQLSKDSRAPTNGSSKQ